MNTKLVVVTVRFQDRVNTRLVTAWVENGKVKVPESFITHMASELGARNGDTIQVG